MSISVCPIIRNGSKRGRNIIAIAES